MSTRFTLPYLMRDDSLYSSFHVPKLVLLLNLTVYAQMNTQVKRNCARMGRTLNHRVLFGARRMVDRYIDDCPVPANKVRALPLYMQQILKCTAVGHGHQGRVLVRQATHPLAPSP